MAVTLCSILELVLPWFIQDSPVFRPTKHGECASANHHPDREALPECPSARQVPFTVVLYLEYIVDDSLVLAKYLDLRQGCGVVVGRRAFAYS